MTIVLLLLACESIQSLVSEHYPQQYTPEAGVANAGSPGLELIKVADGASETTDLHFPRQHTDRLLVATKGGTLWQYNAKNDGYVKGGIVMSSDVRTGSEQGLLGVALHPQYHQNGLIYVHLSPKQGDRRSEISEWLISDMNSELWTAKKQRVLLDVAQPYANHNGGQIRFGSDGFLYIAFGDGGWRDDPKGHGQNWGSLLGAILRIDPKPSGSMAYGVPADNPYLNQVGAKPELFAIGLRNPWRFTFANSGRLIVADVGQNAYEEISVVQKGDNLGWKLKEGFHNFAPDQKAAHLPLVDPVFEYPHKLGKSITGGEIVSDGSVLDGRYIFADFVSGRFWAMNVPSSNQKTTADVIGKFSILPSTFGKDVKGRVYVADYGSGEIYRLSTKSK